MAKVALGTISTAGGGGLNTSTTPSNVFVENRQIALYSSKVTSHGTGVHASSTVSQASTNVFAGPNKLGVAREGDLTTCAHPIVGGSGSVNCN